VAPLDLNGKRAIVTGASSGIGLGTALSLAAAGVSGAGGARRVERIET
jgi:2-deoxy-D-gluconate 3-dehydrogenase